MSRASAVVAVAAVLGGLALPGRAGAAPSLYVGAADDYVLSQAFADPKAPFTLAALAGFGAIRITVPWTPVPVQPPTTSGATPTAGTQPLAGPLDPSAYQTVAQAAAATGMRLIVSIVPATPDVAPQDDIARGQFAAYVSSLARALPTVKDFVIANEPNSGVSWLPQYASGKPAAASAYVALLAACYDALKAVNPSINVLGGALAPAGADDPGAATPSVSPAPFIAAMGAAYRASRRAAPLMDAFDLHVYPHAASEPPALLHPAPSTTLGIADYAALVRALGRAFDGTKQPGSKLPIVYDGYGVKTTPPTAKVGLYANAGTPAAADAVPEKAQAASYGSALELAFCQPTVAGFIFSRVVDDADLAGWHSGLYYPDLAPKSDLQAVAKSVLASRRGALATCPGLTEPAELASARFPAVASLPASNRSWSATFACVRDCLYLLELERFPDGTPVLAGSGRLDGGVPRTVALPASTVDPGTYRYTLRIVSPKNPGPLLVQSSPPLTVG